MRRTDRGGVADRVLRYPRVLHIGMEGIGAPSNTGTTLGSMFGKWPEDRLLQVLVREPIATSFPYLLAPPSHAPVEVALRIAMRGYRRISGDGGSGGASAPAETDGLNRAVRRMGSLSRGERLRSELIAAMDLSWIHLPHEMMEKIEEFRPTVIHSLLGSVRMMRMCLALSRRLGIPCVPHYMDDWPATFNRRGQLWGLAERPTHRLNLKIVEAAPLLLAIGSDMASEYADRYRRRTVVVGNSVERGEYERADLVASPHAIRYVGGLHLGRDAVVGRVATAAHAAAGGWVVELVVPPHDERRAQALCGSHANVRHLGSVRPDEVSGVLCNAGALLFIESFDEDLLSFTRLSMSTKVPQYLAAGRPTLVVGPRGQSSIRAFDEFSAGRCVVVSDERDLEGAVRALVAMNEPDNTLDGPLPAVFNAEATRLRLLEALESAAHGDDAAERVTNEVDSARSIGG